MKKIIPLLSILLLASCSPKIATNVLQKHQGLNATSKIHVFNKGVPIPDNAIIIGKSKIGDSGFTTNCGFDVMLEIAKNEARKIGANAMAITEHILPSFYGSSCHRLNVNLLKIENLEEELQNTNKIDSIKSNSVGIKSETNTLIDPKKMVKSKNKNFMILTNIAKSYRIAKSPDNLNDTQKKYIKNLKSGISYDVSAYYANNDQGGFGIKYNVYKSSGALANQFLVLNDGAVVSGSVSDNITISFIGPSMIALENQNSKLGEGNLEVAIGYMSYQNDIVAFKIPIKITGSNLGLVTSMGYHFKILPSFLVGGQVNFIGGVLKKLKYTYADGTSKTEKLKEGEFENLWRIDLALGAKFRF